MLRVCTLSGILILLCPGTALAQESRGTIAGRVADVQDAGIPHARIIITNVETGVDTVLQTNDRGAYLAPLLIPGNYRIAAECQGFRRFTRSGITVSVNDNLQIDIKLEIGELAQTI